MSYIIYKVGGFFFKILTLGGMQKQQSAQREHPRRPTGSNINVDYVPQKNDRKSDDAKGGEYVDFEEVK